MSSLFHSSPLSFFFFFNDTATTEIYTLSLHDALPILKKPSHPPAAAIEAAAAAPEVRCSGAWTLEAAGQLERQLAAFAWPSGAELVVDGSAIDAMDSAGAWLLHRAIRALEGGGRTVRLEGLHPRHAALLRLIQSQGAEGAPPAPAPRGLLGEIGLHFLESLQQVVDVLAFLGENALVMLRSLAQPRRIRWRPLLYNLQHAGFNAMPITGLLAFLMGIVIAYQGAEQLRRYGANIFVADMVGLSVLRELAPLLTAIIVAGRSGSAYAAQIGTMKVTEEIDALRTIGIPPLELLVLPKMLALIIALPLLTAYADILGVLGGMIVAKATLGVGFDDFLDRFGSAIKLSSYLVGIGKAPVFAAIIALIGCYHGFQVSGGADAVGRQTTVSVVQAIFLIIIADALFSVIFSWLRI